MLTSLLILALSLTGASEALLKDGKYSDTKYGLEVHVANHEAQFAKMDESIIPLTKKGEISSGSITKDETTTLLSVTTKDKKSIYTDIAIERNLAKGSDEQTYNFKDIGLKVTVKNNLIHNFKIGMNKNNRAEIELNADGTIAEYTMQSNTDCPYALDIISNELNYFWCKNCKFSTTGNDKNIILIEDTAYIQFDPTMISFYNISGGGKNIINTYDGTHLDITTYFYNGSKELLNTSTEFKVETDNVKLKTSARVVLKKSL